MLNLPPEFDAGYYRREHPDLVWMSEDQARDHFETYGRKEGRHASPASFRHHFIDMVPRDSRLLEIGPAHKPAFRGPNVRYFDVLDADGLRNRAVHFGEDPAGTPDTIHYLSPDGNLGIVKESFDYLYSSHSIEHQPDLLQHLKDCSGLLNRGGLYFVISPDKRFCFDHDIPESTLGEVVEAHLLKRNRHRLADFIDQHTLASHNESPRHWMGDSPPVELDPKRVADALAQVRAMDGQYFDVHAWRFSSSSFRQVLVACYETGFSALRPIRVYDTVRGSNEFCAVFARD